MVTSFILTDRKVNSRQRPARVFGRAAIAAFVLGGLWLTPSRLLAAISESQVLVVYNSAATDATTLKDAYLAAHPGIPAANVVNLNNAALNVADLTSANFVTLVRDQIRSYLLAAGPPAPADIVAIVLIRPFPHRIRDTDNALVGDNPGIADDELLAGDSNNASVDAELVLLWQDLITGEAGGTMDSKSDNMIDNPYHQLSSQIGAFSRVNIQTAKTFLSTAAVYWRLGGTGATLLTPGDMYLVCRIDGNSLADAVATIDRAEDLYVNQATTRILLDEFNVATNQDLDDDGLLSNDATDRFWAGDDYEETTTALQAAGWDVRYDGTAEFIDSTQETNFLIGYASYGGNHSLSGLGESPPGGAAYIDNYNFAPGAMFNTVESYNGRALNGLTTFFNQEQVADFVSAGGTFAIGMVWEPFTFTLPDNEFMMTGMLVNGLTWGEAAYTSIPALSWHHVVLGDPLGKTTILNDPGLPKGDLNGDTRVDGLDIAWYTDLVVHGPANYHATFPTLDPIARGDFTGDQIVDLADAPQFINALLPP
ncbi:MAG TPA: hypothetical protein VJZ71_05555 [Phycisphaerae bacterium]|nr:hypothetical protein [Phycisphaerae bacterium]